MLKAPDGPVPVVVMGLGFIGQEVARAALSSPEVQLVGAMDVSPSLSGKKLADVLGVPSPAIRVVNELAAALGKHKKAVVLQATGSRLPQVAEQIFEVIKRGASVVSTCEELSFPYLRYAELSDKLDRAAARAGVSVLGTGVNPGFVLDRLIAVAGQACGPVQRVIAERVVDARTRREALQRKVGAGLSDDEFNALLEKDQLGHVGLVESAAMAALGLGLDCDDFEEEILPVVAEEDIHGGAFVVKKGRVAGIHQIARGLADGVERVRLSLTIALGAKPTGDRITIDAEPRVELEIRGGYAGDRATANLVVNAAPRVAAAQPGLLTVLDLPAGR